MSTTNPSNFSILIVEDNLSFAIELDMLIREIGYQVKGRIDNSAEALESILLDPPDLVLMDIQIKGRQSGLEIAEQVKDKQIPILFISSIEEKHTYERARMTNFVGFLVKPVRKFSIRTAVELAISHLSQKKNIVNGKTETSSSKEHLYFNNKGVFHKVAIAEILYIKADGDQTITYTKASKFFSFSSLRALDELLENHNFLKVHRSYLAHITNVTSIDTNNQEIGFSEVKIPFSRRMKKELIEQLPFI